MRLPDELWAGVLGQVTIHTVRSDGVRGDHFPVVSF